MGKAPGIEKIDISDTEEVTAQMELPFKDNINELNRSERKLNITALQMYKNAKGSADEKMAKKN